MGVFKVKYLRTKKKRGKTYYFWEPKSEYVIAGELVATPDFLAAKPLGTDAAAAHTEAQKINELLVNWRKGDASKPILEDTVDWLIAEFKKDEKFKNLAAGTRKLYMSHFKDIQEILGDVPITEMVRSSAREFCTSFKNNARKPSAIAATCRVLFGHAIDLDKIKVNPFAELRISKPAPRKAVWSHEDEEKLRPAAEANNMLDVLDAAIIGIYSAQRPQDIRGLAANHYDGKWWRVTQKKTGTVIDIPIYKIKKLKAVLDRLMESRESPLLLLYKATGKPFSKDMLCSQFRKLCKHAGIGDDLQFRDFRRTTVVRLGEAGCSNAEIASITGHSNESVAKILKVYLPTNRTMAMNAAQKLGSKKGQKLELALVLQEK